MEICQDKLKSENILVTDLSICDEPTDRVYVFFGKDNKGRDVAFELSEHNDLPYIFIPCLTIDSKVYFYNTFTELSKYWREHDLIKIN
ncbi:MAG: hypothetical protein K0R54_9 [Clostridiaceae bacterium]|jgi:hypothetical protein|nr:hypothetical protein [Clostridiaceae bacterium]